MPSAGPLFSLTECAAMHTFVAIYRAGLRLAQKPPAPASIEIA